LVYTQADELQFSAAPSAEHAPIISTAIYSGWMVETSCTDKLKNRQYDGAKWPRTLSFHCEVKTKCLNYLVEIDTWAGHERQYVVEAIEDASRDGGVWMVIHATMWA
jgi:hypothetical protein